MGALGIALRCEALGGGGLSGIISDDFTTLNAAWLNGALAAPTVASVSGNKLLLSPGGTEKNTTANAASDPFGNETNGVAGWGTTQATLSVESVDIYAGSYALKATANDGTNDRVARSLALTANLWYRVSLYHKRGTAGTTQQIKGAAGTGFAGLPTIASGAAYAQYLASTQASINSCTFEAWAAVIGAAGDNILVDNASVLELTEANLFLVRPLNYAISSIAANVWRTSYTQKGVVLFKDINNFILAYLDGGGNVLLKKRVGGTWAATLGSAVVAYVAGTVLTLTPNTAGTQFTVSYGGTALISDVPIADLDLTTGQWYGGVFSTYGVTVLNDAFANFVATHIT